MWNLLSPYDLFVRLPSDSILPGNITSIVHKDFRTLRYHQAQVRSQQQPNQINALNMARFRKAVYSALWVQSALVVCYLPVYTVGIVITLTKKYSLLLIVARRRAVIFLSFNSTLNPFLYCWKISEVRQAVKLK